MQHVSNSFLREIRTHQPCFFVLIEEELRTWLGSASWSGLNEVYWTSLVVWTGSLVQPFQRQATSTVSGWSVFRVLVLQSHVLRLTSRCRSLSVSDARAAHCSSVTSPPYSLHLLTPYAGIWERALLKAGQVNCLKFLTLVVLIRSVCSLGSVFRLWFDSLGRKYGLECLHSTCC